VRHLSARRFQGEPAPHPESGLTVRGHQQSQWSQRKDGQSVEPVGSRANCFERQLLLRGEKGLSAAGFAPISSFTRKRIFRQNQSNAIGLPEKSCTAIPSGTNIPSQPATSAACAISHCSIGSPPGMTIPYRMPPNLTLRSYPCLDVFYHASDNFAGIASDWFATFQDPTGAIISIFYGADRHLRQTWTGLEAARSQVLTP